jgi:NADH-quinone oxidoreductase subunit C
VPDAPGLELIRGEIERDRPGAVLATSFDRAQAALIVDPSRVLDVLSWLRDEPGHRYDFLSSLHVADYLPAEPRFGVHYELLNRDRVERIRVKAMLGDPAASSSNAPGNGAGLGAAPPSPGDPAAGGERRGSRTEPPHRPQDPPARQDPKPDLPQIDSCVSLFPTADFQEREAFDFFGIVFRGHPDLTRILMPEDYVGWPQRRDFPVGGEPVTFTYNERRYG